MKQHVALILGIAVLTIIATGCSKPQIQEEPLPHIELDETAEIEVPTTLLWNSDALGEISAPFDFEIEVPANWNVEYIPSIEAINFYNPTAPGVTPLEQSQLFVRYFKANTFLTLNTVTIHSRKELTLNGRPAVRYDIEKNSGVANFPSQPSWRNERHFVTDIRSTDDSPTVFYVFGQRPDLDDTTFNEILDSITFNPSTLHKPIDHFEERVTLKPFGLYVTPDTSPVQPELFQGYHTGVDAEIFDGEETLDLDIYAIADGTVRWVTEARGYGGVVVIEHRINETFYTAVYGHLDLNSITLQTGNIVKRGQMIGHLGDSYSNETDGERKHLHLSLFKGTEYDIRGYVQNEEELSQWIDPLELVFQ